MVDVVNIVDIVSFVIYPTKNLNRQTLADSVSSRPLILREAENLALEARRVLN